MRFRGAKSSRARRGWDSPKSQWFVIAVVRFLSIRDFFLKLLSRVTALTFRIFSFCIVFSIWFYIEWHLLRQFRYANWKMKNICIFEKWPIYPGSCTLSVLGSPRSDFFNSLTRLLELMPARVASMFERIWSTHCDATTLKTRAHAKSSNCSQNCCFWHQSITLDEICIEMLILRRLETVFTS